MRGGGGSLRITLSLRAKVGEVCSRASSSASALTFHGSGAVAVPLKVRVKVGLLAKPSEARPGRTALAAERAQTPAAGEDGMPPEPNA